MPGFDGIVLVEGVLPGEGPVGPGGQAQFSSKSDEAVPSETASFENEVVKPHGNQVASAKEESAKPVRVTEGYWFRGINRPSESPIVRSSNLSGCL